MVYDMQKDVFPYSRNKDKQVAMCYVLMHAVYVNVDLNFIATTSGGVAECNHAL